MEKILKNLHWFIIFGSVINFYLLYDTSSTNLTTLESELINEKNNFEKNKKSEKDIKNYYENIMTEKARIETVAKEIEKMQQLLPADISDTETITFLKSLADATNIKDISIAPDVDIPREFYIARRYKIKMKATFLQLLIMLEKIGESTRILNIGESSFSKPTQSQRGKFQVIQGEFVMEAYRYNSEYKEDRGIDGIEKKFQDEQLKSRVNN